MAHRGEKTINFTFPLKGWDEGLASTAQKRGTTRDALNVLPFDVSAGRGRGGQRPGLAKLLDDDFGGGVNGLHQIALGLVPALPTTLFSEPFDQFDGSDITTLGGGTRWLTLFQDLGNGDGVGEFTTADPDAIYIHGSTFQRVAIRDAADDGSYAAKLQQDISLAGKTSYEVSIVVRPDASALGNGISMGLLLRLSRAATTITQGLIVDITTDADGAITVVSAYSVGGAEEFLFELLDTPIDPGAEFTFKVVVSGNSFTVYAGDTELGAFETDHLASNDGVGFYLMKSSGGGYTGDSGLAGVHDFAVVVPGAEEDTQPRDNRLVIVAAGDVYCGTIDSQSLVASEALTTAKPRLTDLFNKVYLTDGTNTKVLDVRAGTIDDLAADSGKGTVPAGCRLCCTWRGRLVLAAPDDNPQNVFMSRAGVPTDWLYGQSDELTAVALNASTAGRIGQPVMALIPWRDDVLIIGADHSIYALQGDPAASSGQIITISDSIGILQHESTCIAPDGSVYFVGTGGFFVMSAGGSPRNLSAGRLDEFFRAINRKTHYVECEYDRDANQVWIFVTSIASGASTHLVYDLRTDSFWKQSFPNTVGPLAALVYDGDGPLDRKLLLGGRDGYVRQMHRSATDDDGTAVSSYVLIGPVQPEGDGGEFIIHEWRAVTGSGTTGLTVQVLAGNAVEAAASASPTTLATYTTAGRQSRNLTRFRANSFFAKLANSTDDKTWSLESLQAVGFPGGIVR